jgi:ABC-type sulfate transport system permease subunit
MKQKLRSFKNNRQGIAWVIGVAFLSVALMPVVYFPLSMAWDQTYAAVSEAYVFTGIYVNVITVVQFIISYVLVFGLLFTIAWAITNAKSRRYDP